MDIFNILSNILRYVFVTIIYIFIFAIIRLIFKDIRTMTNQENFEKVQSNPVLRVKGYRDKTFHGSTNEYPLDKERMIIGRNNTCDILVQDIMVSNRHVCLWKEAGEWYIRDLSSQNGTKLNGSFIEEPFILDDGDIIKIGELELEFRV